MLAARRAAASCSADGGRLLRGRGLAGSQPSAARSVPPARPGGRAPVDGRGAVLQHAPVHFCLRCPRARQKKSARPPIPRVGAEAPRFDPRRADAQRDPSGTRCDWGDDPNPTRWRFDSRWGQVPLDGGSVRCDSRRARSPTSIRFDLRFDSTSVRCSCGRGARPRHLSSPPPLFPTTPLPLATPLPRRSGSRRGAGLPRG